MPTEDIPEDVKAFINRHIFSVEQLEVLLLLAAHPEKEWSADDVNRELRTSVASTAVRLTDLRSRDLIKPGSSGERYRYSASPDMENTIVSLSRVYKERKVSVIELIYKKTEDAIRRFSDAFRIKKKEEDK